MILLSSRSGATGMSKNIFSHPVGATLLSDLEVKEA